MKKQSIIDLLRSRGFRATDGRIALIEALSKRARPEPMDAVATLVSRTLDAANVYRALEAFMKAGIVRSTDFRDGKTYYELAVDREHHHHIVCEKCGKIEDVHGCVPSLEKGVLSQSKSFSSVNSHSLEFFGVCKACVR